VSSFLSFGLLGYALHYAAYPIAGFVFAPMSAWRPDVVWPLIVAAGMVWSLRFLPAGVMNHALAAHGVPSGRRGMIHGLVPWVGAVTAWLFLIATIFPRSGTDALKEAAR